ncbi:conjugative transposon protein TraM [Mucilaginibacter sp. SJ]|uniref:conjugative transposon protein TraM n=1 Tax=Mucilaginibacter sp. SJ TaxID=3029053 RepID=UPI0023A972DA|nr:conjugative transposon protein TraM [Mucilaginibacter sp. SJ]WEA01721.1 conjugative transposon protein TraM [Mucilaginibacter sp. SJ]
MKIDLKQPKYVLPVLILPFLCLFFYIWRSGKSEEKPEAAAHAGLNPSVGEVASGVKKGQLQDKLDAYRNTYKEAYGQTAVTAIPRENSSNPAYIDTYSNRERQQRTLDSIAKAAAASFSQPAKQLAIDQQPFRPPLTDNSHVLQTGDKPEDPMALFRKQMAYVDSIGKQNDPDYKEQKRKQEAEAKKAAIAAAVVRLPVTRYSTANADFNTVMPKAEDSFISAVIDENMTGYAGSRLRLKLLEDIRAGGETVKKGTLLYAQISGFSEQRVTLSITSILSSGKILPVKLEVYDTDGLPGLFIPSSSFREFTKELGSSSVQGVTIDGGTGNNQFVMSTAGKLFQSTSSAIAELIRKNKAKLKYNSFIYLIDNEALQNAQKSY